MRTTRLQIETVAAMLALVASLGTVCTCVPPTVTAPDEHSCCPADEALALTALQPHCCANVLQGSATLATDGAPAPPAWGVGAASISPPERAAAARAVRLPVVLHPPLVLRI